MRFFFGIWYRVYRLISGLRYWIIRRFTRPGLAFLGGTILLAMMAPDTDNNVAYQGFTLLLFLLVISVLGSLVFRGRFSATRLLPRFGTVGAPLRYSILVRNRSRRAQRALTLLENLADPRPSFDQWLAAQLDLEKHASLRITRDARSRTFSIATTKDVLVPAMPPAQETSVAAELLPLRRGVLRFNGVTLARPDPLGLFRAFRRVAAAQSVLILPKRYPLPPIPLPGALKYQQGGVALATIVGQSEEFVALRDYRPGDPMRHIHWRSWARTGKPVVKEFEDEFFVRHALVLDTFTTRGAGEVFEEAVSIAASFACTMRTQESLLDLLFIGPESYCITAGRGVGHADQMLEVLAAVQPCKTKSFTALEHLVLNHVKEVSGCICVLLDWDAARQEFIRKLRALNAPVMVLVVVERGNRKPPLPGPMRDDPQNFHVLEAGQVEQGLRRLA